MTADIRPYIGLPSPPIQCSPKERNKLEKIRAAAFTAHCEAGKIEQEAKQARSRAKQLIRKYAEEYRKVLGEQPLFDPATLEDN